MAQQPLHFVTLLGSLRRRSLPQAIANTLDELAPDDVQVSLLDPLDTLPLHTDDLATHLMPESVERMCRTISAADGVVIVTLEHTCSVPAALKNALDWLAGDPSRPLRGKATAIQMAAHDGSGILAQVHLRQILLSHDAEILDRPEVIVTDPDCERESLVRDERTRRDLSLQLAALAAFVRDRNSR